MPGDATLSISVGETSFDVKVSGRATFSLGPSMRSLANRIENENKDVMVNLSQCLGMDSTFMGILAMIALRGKKNNRKVSIVNSSESSKKLLNGLGLGKLFTYKDDSGHDTRQWKRLGRRDAGLGEQTETVLEAHKTLMETDVGNVEKFKDVVEQVEKDMKKGD
ncbi:MAG: hypothetical protein JW808_03975 [Victivallales bacterium]|nr:hypothetical protein [Victivallales bacterium]